MNAKATLTAPLAEAGRWLSRQPLLVLTLVLLSIGLALSEGLSIMLLIPALDSGAAASLFAKIPGLRGLEEWLARFSDSERTLVIAVLLAAGLTVRGLMQLGSQYLTALIPLRLQCAIMLRNYHALVDADLAYMPERDHGELRTLLHDQPQRVAAVLNGLLTYLVAGILVVFFGSLMLLTSWQMTSAAAGFVLVAHLIMKAISRPWFLWAGETLSRVLARLNSTIGETISALVLVKLRSAEPIMKTRFESVVTDYYNVESQRNFFTELQSPVLTTMAGLFVCGLLVLATFIYGNDKSWTAHFIFFVLCLYRLIAPASRLIVAQGIVANNLDAFAATERFIAEAERSRLPNGDRRFVSLTQGIRLDQASLTYIEERGPALDRVDMSIGRGEIVALVGASGAGKTSILTLLMRLRDPKGGRVLLDDVDLRDYDVASWRRRIASVSQDIILFNDTVRNNLTFGLGDVSDEALWSALRDASADDFVRELPGELDAPLGDAGGKLSGGQRQRLALARALLADPELLILDEATSHLDSVTEATIQRTIEAFRRRRSVFIVAHRLSTVRNADRIYVLEAGKVVQCGTHPDLSATPGQYRKLFEAQQALSAEHAA